MDQPPKTDNSHTEEGPMPMRWKAQRWFRGLWIRIKKDTRSTEWLIVLLTAVLAITSYFQWTEIRSGSADTRDLAVAAGKQAEKMKDMSVAAEKIQQAANRMSTEEQRIADSATRALEASNRNSKAALDATVAASRVSERAYITIGRPDGTFADILWPKDNAGLAGLQVYFQNNGRIPAKFNWGADVTLIAIVPTDPTVFVENEIAKGYVELPTHHLFNPMFRARARNGKGDRFTWSGTIDIAGGSSYQGVLWEVPKSRMIQLLNLDRPFQTGGRFEYCDGFGQRVCRNFTLNYAKEPYNRFFLVREEECFAAEMQVMHPMPDYDYLPVCTVSERPELQNPFPKLPKPQ